MSPVEALQSHSMHSQRQPRYLDLSLRSWNRFSRIGAHAAIARRRQSRQRLARKDIQAGGIRWTQRFRIRLLRKQRHAELDNVWKDSARLKSEIWPNKLKALRSRRELLAARAQHNR
jgi:hypothetical protein